MCSVICTSCQVRRPGCTYSGRVRSLLSQARPGIGCGLQTSPPRAAPIPTLPDAVNEKAPACLIPPGCPQPRGTDRVRHSQRQPQRSNGPHLEAVSGTTGRMRRNFTTPRPVRIVESNPAGAPTIRSSVARCARRGFSPEALTSVPERVLPWPHFGEPSGGRCR